MTIVDPVTHDRSLHARTIRPFCPRYIYPHVKPHRTSSRQPLRPLPPPALHTPPSPSSPPLANHRRCTSPASPPPSPCLVFVLQQTQYLIYRARLMRQDKIQITVGERRPPSSATQLKACLAPFLQKFRPYESLPYLLRWIAKLILSNTENNN